MSREDSPAGRLGSGPGSPHRPSDPAAYADPDADGQGPRDEREGWWARGSGWWGRAGRDVGTPGWWAVTAAVVTLAVIVVAGAVVLAVGLLRRRRTPADGPDAAPGAPVE